MKNLLTTSLIFLMITVSSVAQTLQDTIQFNPTTQINSAQRILSGNYGKAVTVGAYGEITYNQPEGGNGQLDVQRLVLLFGYKFNDKTQFVTEVEFEHVREVFVEQAFINYNVANNVNLRGGLMLVPFGIINEYHEPTTFNGVERPAVDNVIIPTTWREIGFGVNGRFNEISLAYQAYVFNGFKSSEADGAGGISGLLQGRNALRGGRQRGAESTIDNPTFSVKLDYYGIPGLKIGLSGYKGRTQADDDVEEISGADIDVNLIGLDARYAYRRFTARGQFVYGGLTGTNAYNTSAGRNLGSNLLGWYTEGAFNLLGLRNKQKLFAFARYEKYDTHAATAGDLERNKSFDRTDITTGLSYHIAPGVVVKGDYQFRDNAAEKSKDVQNRLNIGLGVWF